MGISSGISDRGGTTLTRFQYHVLGAMSFRSSRCLIRSLEVDTSGLLPQDLPQFLVYVRVSASSGRSPWLPNMPSAAMSTSCVSCSARPPNIAQTLGELFDPRRMLMPLLPHLYRSQCMSIYWDLADPAVYPKVLPSPRLSYDEEEQSAYTHHDSRSVRHRAKSVCTIWYVN